MSSKLMDSQKAAKTRAFSFCSFLRGANFPLLCLCLLIGPAPLHATSDTPGIGRLNYAGYNRTQHCSAFLTRGGHLVTAGHCVALPPNARLHFLEAYNRGDWMTQLNLRPSSFVLGAPRDLAFVCDAAQGVQRGLTLADELPMPGEAVEVWGYGAPRAHVLQRISCFVQALHGDRSLLLDCAVTPGLSGGPVVRRGAGEIHVIGVMSARASGASLAEILTPEVLNRQCRTRR